MRLTITKDIVRMISSYIKCNFGIRKGLPFNDEEKELINKMWSNRIMRKWILRNCPDELFNSSIKYTYFVTNSFISRSLRMATNIPNMFGVTEAPYIVSNNRSFSDEGEEFDREFAREFIEKRGFFPSTFCANAQFSNYYEERKSPSNEDLHYLGLNTNPDVLKWAMEYVFDKENKVSAQDHMFANAKKQFWKAAFCNPAMSKFVNQISESMYEKVMHSIFDNGYGYLSVLPFHQKALKEEFSYEIDDNSSLSGSIFSCHKTWLYKEIKLKISSRPTSYDYITEVHDSHKFVDYYIMLRNPDIRLFELAVRESFFIPLGYENKSVFDIILKVAENIDIKKYETHEDLNSFPNCLEFGELEDCFEKIFYNINLNPNYEVVCFLVENPHLIITKPFVLNTNPLAARYLRDNLDIYPSAKFLMNRYSFYPEYLILLDCFINLTPSLLTMYSYDSIREFLENHLTFENRKEVPKIYYKIFDSFLK